ncbi:MAG: hypothetical protein K2J85_06805, partial [Anaeroplasmataceae bacterium]|nr:hypothetical protein [Anaeroplasmataceae bacterium]
LCVEGLSNLNLEFINRNGQAKSFILVQEGKTKVTRKYRRSIKQKIKFYKNAKKLSIKSLYDFNE